MVPQLGVLHCTQRKASGQGKEASDRAMTMPLPTATPLGECVGQWSMIFMSNINILTVRQLRGLDECNDYHH